MTENVPSQMPQQERALKASLPETRISRRVDSGLRRLSEAASWIWLALLGVIVTNVTLRYVFASGRIELEELQWHLYAIGFLVGLSYCVQNDSHIRVDVLHERLSPRMRAWVDLYGSLLLALPFCALVLIYSIPFVLEAWRSSEISASPGGLPARFLIKAALPIAMILVIVGLFSRLLRLLRQLFPPDSLAKED